MQVSKVFDSGLAGLGALRRLFAVVWPFTACLFVHGESRADSIGPRETSPAGASAAGLPVASTLDLQVELHRRGFSCGSIDGVLGDQTAAALRAFQRRVGVADTGIVDAATREYLQLSAPALGEYTFTAADLAGLHPVPDTWLGKSQMTDLGYASALELASERYHAHPDLLRQLNPGVDWSAVTPGTKVVIPAVERVVVTGTAAEISILLGQRELEVIDSASQVIAQFPVSIALIVEKRPVGSLHITTIVTNPDYTFDPESYPESAEGKSLGRMLVLPPGPNNPVGLAWIGLDRPGYGIHGTPEPENVGRTESHGCFRLANWDALTLAGLVRLGMPVNVEP
jgi:lipoprotein-anchoring transpeptidase ErfK/SrfK